MQDLTVALVQTELYWENAQANLAMLEEKLWQYEGKADLILLPEMFSTGFSMHATTLAEPMNFTSFKWMKQMAAQKQAVICGSVIIKEEGKYYNRLIWMRPDGSFERYDKRHTFRMAGEHEIYTSGKKKLIVELKGWNICPMVCYDLRFPVWSRNRGLNYDLLLYVANWPEPRRQAWTSLLQARAIENLSYCIGVNRLGEDGNGIVYAGDSMAFGPKGDSLVDAAKKDGIFEITLSKEDLENYRTKFPAHLDADDFEIK